MAQDRYPTRTAAPARARRSLRADFQPGEFEQAIDSMGYRLLWEQAARCPCRNNDETSQPNAGCPVCDGYGWEYHSPLEILGIVDALDTNTDAQIAFGIWTFGSANVTVRSEHRPAYKHRYTLLDPVMEFSELRLRTGIRDRLRYPVTTVTMRLMKTRPDGEQVLRPAVEVGVLRLRLMDTDTRLPGELVQPGEDFDIVDGRIDWSRGDVRGTAPAVGGLYSVAYYHHPRYVVETATHAIRDTRVKFKQAALRKEAMPVTVVCKLDFDTAQSGAGFGG